MIEAKTKDRDRTKTKTDDNKKWTDAESKIVVFDEENSDSVSYKNFLKMNDEHDEWWTLNNAGYSIKVDKAGKNNKKYYQARRAKLSVDGVSASNMIMTVKRFALDEADLEEKVITYKLKKETVEAFAIVAKQTTMNEGEMIQRRIFESEENVQYTGLKVYEGGAQRASAVAGSTH